MNTDFLAGMIIGLLAVPFLKYIWSIYLWSIPEFGIIEEPWKTETQEEIYKAVNEMTWMLERRLYYGEEK